MAKRHKAELLVSLEDLCGLAANISVWHKPVPFDHDDVIVVAYYCLVPSGEQTLSFSCQTYRGALSAKQSQHLLPENWKPVASVDKTLKTLQRKGYTHANPQETPRPEKANGMPRKATSVADAPTLAPLAESLTEAKRKPKTTKPTGKKGAK